MYISYEEFELGQQIRTGVILNDLNFGIREVV